MTTSNPYYKVLYREFFAKDSTLVVGFRELAEQNWLDWLGHRVFEEFHSLRIPLFNNFFRTFPRSFCQRGLFRLGNSHEIRDTPLARRFALRDCAVNSLENRFFFGDNYLEQLSRPVIEDELSRPLVYKQAHLNKKFFTYFTHTFYRGAYFGGSVESSMFDHIFKVGLLSVSSMQSKASS